MLPETGVVRQLESVETGSERDILADLVRGACVALLRCAKWPWWKIGAKLVGVTSFRPGFEPGEGNGIDPYTAVAYWHSCTPSTSTSLSPGRRSSSVWTVSDISWGCLRLTIIRRRLFVACRLVIATHLRVCKQSSCTQTHILGHVRWAGKANADCGLPAETVEELVDHVRDPLMAVT